jgi:O-antigen/teichoic acid export membrane protein
MDNIKRNALKGVIWVGSESFVRLGLQFGISVALARILTPEEFGIVALVYVFMGIAAVLVDGGFNSAIVQRRDIESAEIVTIFHFQWIVALSIGLALGLASPLVARFYGYPIIEPLIWMTALNLFVSALNGVHKSLLCRAFNFRLLVIAGSVSTAVSGLAAVLLAINGAGVWALASQTLVASFISLGIFWSFHHWRPTMVFRLALLKKSFAFGGFLLLSGLLDALYGRLYNLFIGKSFGAAELGQYNRAVGIQGMPMGMLTGTIFGVAFPTFCALQDDKERLRAGVRKAMCAVMAINIPAMLGLLAVAEPFVLTIFGEVWRPSIWVLRILCLAGLVFSLDAFNWMALISQGHSRLCFRIDLVKKGLAIVTVLLAAPFGIEALAWSQLAVAVMWFALQAYFTGRMLGYTWLMQLSDCLPWFTAAVMMAFSVSIVPFVITLPMAGTLVLQVILGAVLYLSFWITWDISLIREMLALIPGRRIVKA